MAEPTGMEARYALICRARGTRTRNTNTRPTRATLCAAALACCARPEGNMWCSHVAPLGGDAAARLRPVPPTHVLPKVARWCDPRARLGKTGWRSGGGGGGVNTPENGSFLDRRLLSSFDANYATYVVRRFAVAGWRSSRTAWARWPRTWCARAALHSNHPCNPATTRARAMPTAFFDWIADWVSN